MGFTKEFYEWFRDKYGDCEELEDEILLEKCLEKREEDGLG